MSEFSKLKATAAEPTYVENQSGELSGDLNGYLRTKVSGSVAHDAVDSGNPIKIGGKASTSTPTAVANGDRVNAYFDSEGRLVVLFDKLIEGEDQTNHVMKTEQQFVYTNITSATTTTVKSGAGFLHSIVVNLPVANGVITLYDNTAGSGTKIGTITFGATVLSDVAKAVIFNVKFTTGLTIVTSASTDLTISTRA